MGGRSPLRNAKLRVITSETEDDATIAFRREAEPSVPAPDETLVMNGEIRAELAPSRVAPSVRFDVPTSPGIARRGERKRRRTGVLVAAAASVAIVALVVALWPPRVKVAGATRGRAVDAVFATGTVEAVSRVSVRAKTPGTIVEIAVKDGAFVRKGDLLARIDNPALANDLVRGEAELSAANAMADTDSPQVGTIRAQGAAILAELAAAKKDLARVESLVASGALSPAEADHARARVAQLSASAASNAAHQRETRIEAKKNATRQAAEVRTLTTRAADTEVRAPFDGVVLSKSVEVGEVVALNQPLFRVGDTSKFVIEAAVDESDVARIRDGRSRDPASAAAVRLSAFPGRLFDGHVVEIVPDADRVRKTFTVKIELNAPPSELRSGMSVETNIVCEAHDGLLIPTTAETHGDVWVVSNGRVRRRHVTPGVRDLTRVEVKDGLSPGELVVVTAPNDLRDGMWVRSVVETAKAQMP
jgi:multidrug efflux pump subunit AcrA (membrane-fusion protein)